MKTHRLRLLLAFGWVALWPLGARAQNPFADLIQRVPSSANSVVILNMERIKASPMGVRLGWAEKFEEAFSSGMIRVPPKATRFIIASQIDFEFKTPNWEFAVADLSVSPPMDRIAKEYGGTPDTLDGLPAVVLPNDAYAIQLGPNTLAAMAPANRQNVLRWIRELRSPTRVPLPDYLAKAANYSDVAQTEVVMALDLQGVFPQERISHYLSTKTYFDELKVDRKEVANLLAGIRGVRIGVRIDEKPLGRISVDFMDPVKLSPEAAKRILLEALADAGARIEELEQFKAGVGRTDIWLQGYLSATALRRMMSVVDSPAPTEVAGPTREVKTKVPPKGQAKPKTKEVSPGEVQDPVQLSVKYFKTIMTYFDDLRADMRDRKTIAQSQLFFDRYARKIERLPMLDVDPELVDYGAFVAQSLRQLAGSVRTSGAQAAVATKDVTANSPGVYHTGSYGYARAGYWGGTGFYGNYGVYDPRATFRWEGSQRRLIRTQTNTEIAGATEDVKQNVLQATSEIRRKMTDKYQVQF